MYYLVYIGHHDVNSVMTFRFLALWSNYSFQIKIAELVARLSIMLSFYLRLYLPF